MNKELNLHDRIANLSLIHFVKLKKTGKPTEREWTVLSTITLENTQTQKLEVVALGTGSKCIGKTLMSPNGDILNDSHAEVMCRRAFLYYVYDNLIHHSATNSGVFEQQNTKKFRMKDDYKLHFFTTQVPCGDAAIFSKQTEENVGNTININNCHNKRKSNSEISVTEKSKKRRKCDIFRTGAKCLNDSVEQDLHLEGADYHVTGVVRTKPGRGTQTLSVSCSDKLAKWCHLGIQGALLMHFFETPIYLSTFTIAANVPFDFDSLNRALYGRLGKVVLEKPYDRQTLIASQCEHSFNFSKSDGKNPSPNSIYWCKTNDPEGFLSEVAVAGRKQGVTNKKKKNADSNCSFFKISKINLLKKFFVLIQILGIDIENFSLETMNYNSIKVLSQEYQQSWKILRKHFKNWTIKNQSLSEFTCK